MENMIFPLRVVAPRTVCTGGQSCSGSFSSHSYILHHHHRHNHNNNAVAYGRVSFAFLVQLWSPVALSRSLYLSLAPCFLFRFLFPCGMGGEQLHGAGDGNPSKAASIGQGGLLKREKQKRQCI